MGPDRYRCRPGECRLSEARQAGNMRAHNKTRPVWPFRPSSGVGAPSADSGNAATLGSLSVPPGWTVVDKTVESDRPSLPDTGIDAAAPGRTFQRALMATITGRAGRPSPRRRHPAPGP
ncbi:PPE family protein, SVP subgroup [Mycobacterium seoulense]|uniref:PPE family protein, SVP subgroup n=2 Tax=Mycobacterium seoulense TaxID=386911 RepID=UPI003CF658B9